MKQGIITKTCAVAAALAMGVSLAACGGGSSADSDKGHVYFMNNKSEVVDQYKQLAEMYTEKTGVQVDVQTGASGTYDVGAGQVQRADHVQHLRFRPVRKISEVLRAIAGHRSVQTAHR